MSYGTYRLCPFITFFAFKSGLATNNHVELLIVPLIIIYFFHSIFRVEIVMYFMPYTSQLTSIKSLQINDH